MKKNYILSKWWGLILLIAFMLGLFWLEVKAPFSEDGHTWAEVGLTFLLFGLVLVWLKANEHAMLMEEMEEYRRRTFGSAPQLRQNLAECTADTTEKRKGKKRRSVPEHALEGRVLPAWVISLSSIFVGLLKALDK